MAEITIPHNFKPRSYQLPILKAIDSGISRIVWVAHRRCGKDKTIVNIVAKKMIQRVGTYYYVFPTFTHAKRVIWDGIDGDGHKFMDHFPEEIIAKKNESDMKLEFKNKSVFQLIGSDKIDAIVGTNPVGVAFSEYAIHDPQAWGFLRPILAENKGWAIFFGTPRGRNHFHQLYSSALHDPQWYAQINRASETKVIAQDVLDQERKEMLEQFGTDSLYQQEYECSFDIQMSINQFISGEIVTGARGRKLGEAQYNFAPIIITVDPSWTGKDELVIAKRQGLFFCILKVMKKNDDDSKVAAIVAQYEDDYNADAVFIDLGYGTGIYSAGKSMNREWMLVAFGSSSSDPQYVNKRAEMWGLMRKWLQEGGAIPNDPVLCDELQGPEAYIIQTGIHAGKIQIESKDHMKSRGVASPNRADSLALSFAFPVVKKNPLIKKITQNKKLVYDPFEDFDQPVEKQREYDPMSRI